MGDYKGRYVRKHAAPDGAGYQPATVRKPGKKKNPMRSVAALVAADGLLIFMCLADKIELGYGLVFLAAASAILGGRVNHARL